MKKIYTFASVFLLVLTFGYPFCYYLVGLSLNVIYYFIVCLNFVFQLYYYAIVFSQLEKKWLRYALKGWNVVFSFLSTSFFLLSVLAPIDAFFLGMFVGMWALIGSALIFFTRGISLSIKARLAPILISPYLLAATLAVLVLQFD